ncbi:MAG: CvpA family protein [Erysipelotrichaceae bacterium]|nr:CvpA family protein [Erysipelotrichaceae bacterium]
MFKKVSVFTAIAWIIGWLIAYYFILPPINPSSFAFWSFFTPALVIPIVLITQTYSLKDGFNKGKAFYPMVIVIITIIVFFVGILIASPIFSASAYTNRISVVTSSFEDDIQEVDFSNLPLLDKASTQKVGDRVVGQIPDLVSQFSVSDEYTLINYQSKIVRVTPLEHNGLFKYLGNTGGTAGYVMVDSTTGEATLVQLDEGLKYLPSAYFFQNLRRHVQVNNPFDILGEFSFELDEEGNPYWIIQTLKYSWVGMKKAVSGIIVVNAVTGEMVKYKVGVDIPKWIDNVYDADLVTEELDSWGLYQGGYLNSLFSQKNVTQTTAGYTYITMDDDVYMYTGLTSVTNDESNIGFIMVNLRTHDAKFYAVPGAEEYSAMDSAVGAVQEKSYTSTFPLLINLNNRATYLLSLKDDAGLVKMYAFVDVQDYQKVMVTDASLGIEAAANAYLQMMGTADYDETQVMTGTFVIGSINSVIIDGNTYYYLQSVNGEKYSVVASLNLAVTPYLLPGDTISCSYYLNETGINTIVKIEKMAEEVPAETAVTEGEGA